MKKIAVWISLTFLLTCTVLFTEVQFVFPYESYDHWSQFHRDPTNHGEAYQRGAKTNDTLWAFNTGAEVYSSPAVFEGRVYVGNDGGKVFCLNASDGSEFWSYTTDNQVWSSPAVVDGRVYVGSRDKYVYCLNADTGVMIWRFFTDGEVYSSPTVVDGRVYVGTYDEWLFCLDAINGSEIWSYFADGDVQCCPAVVDGRVYFGTYGGSSSDDRILCFNATDGSKIWGYNPPGGESLPWMSSICVSPRDFLYFPLTHGTMHCFDLDGNEQWSFDTEQHIQWCTPACYQDYVYFGSSNGTFYCLKYDTGDLEWRFAVEDDDKTMIRCSPAVASSRVYFGTHDYHGDIKNMIYCLRYDTGRVLWKYSPLDYVDSSPAIAHYNVYVGCADNHIYAFGRPSAEDRDTTCSTTTIPVLIDTNLIAQNITHANVRVTVANEGIFTENINLTVKIQHPDLSNTTIHNEMFLNMQPNNLTYITIVWNNSGFNRYENLTLIAEVDPIPGENYTKDNVCIDRTYVITYPGDINNDKKVDMRDIGSCALGFGADPLHDRWSSNADINRDLKIDMRDIGIAARNFGYMEI